MLHAGRRIPTRLGSGPVDRVARSFDSGSVSADRRSRYKRQSSDEARHVSIITFVNDQSVHSQPTDEQPDGDQPSNDVPTPDWYADPEDSSQYRYWNGSSWTEHRAPRYIESDDLRTPGELLSATSAILAKNWRICVFIALVNFSGYVISLTPVMADGNFNWDTFAKPESTETHSVINDNQIEDSPSGEESKVSELDVTDFTVKNLVLWMVTALIEAHPGMANGQNYTDSLKDDFSLANLAPLAMTLLISWLIKQPGYGSYSTHGDKRLTRQNHQQHESTGTGIPTDTKTHISGCATTSDYVSSASDRHHCCYSRSRAVRATGFDLCRRLNNADDTIQRTCLSRLHRRVARAICNVVVLRGRVYYG